MKSKIFVEIEETSSGRYCARAFYAHHCMERTYADPIQASTAALGALIKYLKRLELVA